MKNVYKNNKDQKLAAYSAMAGALLLGSMEAGAQIVYTDIEDETIEATEIYQIYELDMDGDEATDFIFRAGTANSGTWTFASVFGFTSGGAGNTNNRVIGYSGTYVPYASAFDSGYVVGPKAEFISYPSYYNYAVIASIFGGATYGLFVNESDKFLGLQFELDGDLHYGWIRLDATVDPVTVTIKDYAYDAAADTPIETGATESVNIPVITDDQIFVYSAGDMVNIIVKDFSEEDALVTIYNVAGQNVYSNNLNKAGMQIPLTNFATGIYAVNIFSENGVYNKQVLIGQ